MKKIKELLNYIDDLICNKEIDLAMKLLDELSFDEESSDTCNYLKALCEFKKKNYTKVVDYINLVSNENHNEITEKLKYSSYFHLQNYEEIIKYHFKNEDKFSNMNENFQLIIAISFHKLDLYKNAKELYKQIIVKNKNCIQAINNLSILNLKHENCIEDSLDKLSFVEPRERQLEICNNLALCYIKKGEIKKGFDIFEEALDSPIARENSEFYKVELNYLNNLINIGQIDKAKEIILKNLENNQTSNISLLMLINIYLTTGKIEEASNLIHRIIHSNSFLDEKFLSVLYQTADKINKHKQKVLNTEDSSGINFVSKIENKEKTYFLSKDIPIIQINKPNKKTRNKEKLFNISKRYTSKSIFNKAKVSDINIHEGLPLSSLRKFIFYSFDKSLQSKEDNILNTNRSNFKEIYNSLRIKVIEHKNNKNITDDSIFFHTPMLSLNMPSQNTSNVLTINSSILNLNDNLLIKNSSKSQPIEEEEINLQIKKIKNLYICENFELCKELINNLKSDKRMDIETILANIYFKEKEYSKVISILSKYVDDLSKEDLIILIKSHQTTEITKCYKDILIKYYEKFKDSDEILIEVIKVCVHLSDMQRSKFYIEEVFLASKYKSGELSIFDWDLIINILLSNSTFIDYSFLILEIMRSMQFHTNPYYKYLLGRYFLKKNRVNFAYENFIQIENTHEMKKCSGFYKHFGKIHILLSNIPKAIKYFKLALNINELDSGSALHIGECYIKLEKFVLAKKYINLCLKIDPYKEKNLWLIYSQGRIFFFENELDKASSCFDKCLEMNQICFKALYRKALIRIKMSDFENGEKMLEKCYNINESYFPGYYELFKIKLQLNKKEEAFKLIGVIEDHIHRNHNFIIEYSYYIVNYFDFFENAQKYFQTALKKEGKFVNIQMALNYANLLLQKKQTNKAIEAYQSIININKNDYKICRCLNEIYVYQGKFNLVIENILEYIKNNSELPCEKAYFDIADVYFVTQDFTSAVTYYKLVYKNNKNFDDKLIKKIAFCEFKLNLYQQAKERLVEQFQIKKEMNIFLCVSYITKFYLNNEEDSKDYLYKEQLEFPENTLIHDIQCGKIELRSINIASIMNKLIHV